MFNLSGKKVLLTGATGGLGQKIAETFIAQGATVGLCGTRETELEKLVQTLGAAAYALPCNLTNAESVDNLIADAESHLGHIDILINNAGITRDNLMMRLKDEDYKDVMMVNLEAPFRLSRAVLRGMIKRRWGRIINITSIVGVTGNPGQSNYAAAKAGIIGMSKSLAAEVATRNITVNCIAPGFMVSPMTDKLSDIQKDKLLASIPMNKMGAAEDIAASCIFLASDEAHYITGQTLHVNGGMLMV